MDVQSWNKKQIELMDLYFQNKQESCPISELLKKIKPVTDIWTQVYELLKNSSTDFDDFMTIDKILQTNIEGVNYCIIKIAPWEYLCIDKDKKETISLGKNLYPFNEQFFIENFDEPKVNNPELMYDVINLNKVGTISLLEMIENEPILSYLNDFSYTLKDSDMMTRLYFDMDRGNVTLFFGEGEMKGHVNYIFLDNNLTPRGVSNSTGNKKELYELAKRVADIEIPISVIPLFILEEQKIKQKRT